MAAFMRGRSTAAVAESAAANSSRSENPASGLLAAMEAIAKGDLNAGREIEGGERATVQRLVGSLIERETEVASEFARFAGETSATAVNIGWITHDVREVADSTQAISSAVTELAASIGQIAETTQASAVDAAHVRDGSRDSIADMRQTGDAMRAIASQVGSIAERVRELETAVRQIAEMAGTIEAISSQTNLLALNATIEAARAGEAGRGFAVVAAEVKTLSGNTAKATEQIRLRIATLSSGMDAIRRVTSDSATAVARGEETARVAEARIETLGSEIATIADRMHVLADLLGQQEAATSEISRSVCKISEKAVKVRGEIDTSLSRLVKAENAAIDALNSASKRGLSHHELIAIQGVAASWKRQLAATLLGMVAPSPENESCGGRRLAAWCARVSDQKMIQDLEFGRLKTADDAAHSAARQMMERIRRGDYGSATQAYIEAEAAIDRLIAAALALVATHVRRGAA